MSTSYRNHWILFTIGKEVVFDGDISIMVETQITNPNYLDRFNVKFETNVWFVN